MAAPQYAILRFAKYKGPEISGIEAHNERTKEKYASNPDIDPTCTVDQLNKMMMRDDLSLWEIIEACSFIDICDCYEPMFYPPNEQEDEWRRMRGEYEPEPTLENTSFYVTEPDGTKYFYCGNTRTKVTEFFSPNGQTMDELILNLVRFAARNSVSA